MIQISREAAQVLRDYVGSTLPFGNVHVQRAVNELDVALDPPPGAMPRPRREAPSKCGGCPCADGSGCA